MAQLLLEDSVEFQPQQNPHTFTADAGDVVVIEMVSDEFDTFLTLLTPAGDIWEQNDDYDGSPHATIVAELPETGEYTVLAGSFYGQLGGNYRISINPATDYQQVYDRALELMQSEDYGEASEAYQAAILLVPDQPNAYLGRADALLRHQALRLGEAFEGPESLPDNLRTEIVKNYETAAQLFAASGQREFAELILEQADFIRFGQDS
ncbi:MAG: tetratricopeptide repeat protein [Cyanobacteria bacterium P01_D01_bin.156]